MAKKQTQPPVTGDELFLLLGKTTRSKEFQDVKQRLAEEAQVSAHRSQRYIFFEKNDLTLNLAAGGKIKTVFIRINSPVSLPLKLKRSMGPAAVRKILGKPAFVRPKQPGSTLGPGDIFDFPEFTLAIDYTPDGKWIELVCGMTAQSAPGRAERELAKKVNPSTTR